VEVEARREGLLQHVDIVSDGISIGTVLNEKEFAALFEPLPKPEMVEITLATAIFARDCLQRAGVQLSTLDAAIRAAKQEQTP
jgi:hypothetical protein